MPAERAATIPIADEVPDAAERLANYDRAGAHHLVMGFSGGDWRRPRETRAMLQ